MSKTNFGAVAALKTMNSGSMNGFRPEAIDRQLRHAAAEITRDILICNVAYPAGYQHRELSTLEQFEPNAQRLQALVKFPHRWGFTISILVRHKNLKIQTHSEFLRMSGPVLFEEAIEFIIPEHRRLKDSINSDFIVNTGWIASPAGKALTPEQDMQIYEDMEGFSILAPWQVPEFEKLGMSVETIKN